MSKLHISTGKHSGRGYNATLKRKMDIVAAREGVGFDDNELTDDSSGFPVLTTGRKNGQKYAQTERNRINRLIIPYSGWMLYLEGSRVSSGQFSTSWYITKSSYDRDTLENMKSYMNSRLVSYVVIRYSEICICRYQLDFLSRLVGVDFSRSWTDDELYKEFALTQGEIEEVENWWLYKNKHLTDKISVV